MGKQINFFMLPIDEERFFDFLFSRPSVQLLKTISNSPEMIINRSEVEISNIRGQLMIMDSQFGLSPASIKKHAAREYSESKGMTVPTGDFYYYLDNTMNAPLIEYLRSFIREDNQFLPGRIWAELYRYDNGTAQLKDQAYISWFEAIQKWLKKYLKRDPKMGMYLSKDGKEWFVRNPDQYYDINHPNLK